VATPVKVDSEFLKYCINDYERNIIKERVLHKSNRETAKYLEMSHTTVDKIVNRVKKRIDSAEVLTVKGTSTLYDKDGNVKLQWVKTDVDKELKLQVFKDVINELIEELKSNIKNFKELKEQSEENKSVELFIGENSLLNDLYENDLLTIYPIGDFHLGMFSWEEETGENYDLDIAYSLLTKAFDRLVESTPNSEYTLLANLGDYFHIDDTRNETLRSKNRLDVDSRYPKILKTGLKLIVNIIQKLLTKHKYIIIRNAIGNHDPHTTYFLNEYIRAWFCDNPRIIIEDDVKTFWFYKFGKNLIGITHGDTCKLTDLPEIMASDA